MSPVELAHTAPQPPPFDIHTGPLEPIGLFIQPACLQHKYIRHANSSHIFERPERLRAVLLGVAAAAARLEDVEGDVGTIKSQQQRAEDKSSSSGAGLGDAKTSNSRDEPPNDSSDLSHLLSNLNIARSPQETSKPFIAPKHLHLIPPLPSTHPGQILLHHPALQIAHSPPSDDILPYIPSASQSGLKRSNHSLPDSAYLKELLKWATEAPEKIKETGCEIPAGKGLNQGDLYLGPGSVLAIEGAVQTVCQAVDHVVQGAYPSSPNVSASTPSPLKQEPLTPPATTIESPTFPVTAAPEPSDSKPESSHSFRKAFCAIRPPGHHCGEDSPSGFCYVNNVVVGAMHAYMEHDIDRAIVIDFDLHHGNGTQALMMPLNAATYAEELAQKAGKPPSGMKGRDGKARRGWKGFYGSVHDIYSYPCEDGDLDLVKDASLSLAAHGQYIENVHLQPYSSTSDFFTRIYPLYLSLLARAEAFLLDTASITGHDPDRTILFISAGFDACEHEYEAMQRHDRRVPASFFERYTADIARFADKWCRGKVVSVLEGGYSDRALASGALGHIVGMVDTGVRDDEERKTREAWYGEAEQVLLEKATKKKRTGKLHPFPSEVSHLPHLARTHALLNHFESFGLPLNTSSANGSLTPSGSRNGNVNQGQSVNNTPTGRMTLRTRKPVDVYGDWVTPPRHTIKSKQGQSVKTVIADEPKTGPLQASASVPAMSFSSTPLNQAEPVLAPPIGPPRKVDRSLETSEPLDSTPSWIVVTPRTNRVDRSPQPADEPSDITATNGVSPAKSGDIDDLLGAMGKMDLAAQTHARIDQSRAEDKRREFTKPERHDLTNIPGPADVPQHFQPVPSNPSGADSTAGGKIFLKFKRPAAEQR